VSETARPSLSAGGTNLIDLMKENVARPAAVEYYTAAFEPHRGYARRGLRLGALVTTRTLHTTNRWKRRYPCFRGRSCRSFTAAPQLATNGGNLSSGPDATTSYDTATPPAINASPDRLFRIECFNRMHAILARASNALRCIPQTMCIALAALEAVGARHREKWRQGHPIRRLPSPAWRNAGHRQHLGVDEISRPSMSPPKALPTITPI